MRILVAGGAGFIGGNYLNLMTERYPSDFFVCLDALTYAGNRMNLSPSSKRKNFRFEKGDIRDRKEVFSLFEREGFDLVINFAAESHVDRSIQNPALFMETNALGVGVLLDACLKYDVRRFHQVSTDEVYGDLPLDGKECRFSESSPLLPSSPYSASKAAADLFTLAYRRTYGLSVTISRCSNNYGPYQFPEKLIPLVIDRAKKGERIPVYGDGRNVRDWLFVSDCCQAIDLVARKGRDGEIYNVGAGEERSNLQVVESILNTLGKPLSSIERVPDRPGHDRRYSMDSSKIEKELGWTPLIRFEEGIATTIRWYEDNREWLKDVEQASKKMDKKI